jgi:hypothetical protein
MLKKQTEMGVLVSEWSHTNHMADFNYTIYYI